MGKDFTKANVLFISDDECDVLLEFLKELIKRKYNIRTIGVFVGSI